MKESLCHTHRMISKRWMLTNVLKKFFCCSLLGYYLEKAFRGYPPNTVSPLHLLPIYGLGVLFSRSSFFGNVLLVFVIEELGGLIHPTWGYKNHPCHSGSGFTCLASLGAFS